MSTNNSDTQTAAWLTERLPLDLRNLGYPMCDRAANEIERLRAALPDAYRAASHPDDEAVDAFAADMKAKLAQARASGRGGWEACSEAYLTDMLRDHVAKGDMRDVANIAMMIHQNRKAGRYE